MADLHIPRYGEAPTTPTQDAYDAACRGLWLHRERAEVAVSALVEVEDMIRRFDTPGDPGRTRAFLSDLSRIVERAKGATR